MLKSSTTQLTTTTMFNTASKLAELLSKYYQWLKPLVKNKTVLWLFYLLSSTAAFRQFVSNIFSHYLQSDLILQVLLFVNSNAKK